MRRGFAPFTVLVLVCVCPCLLSNGITAAAILNASTTGEFRSALALAQANDENDRIKVALPAGNYTFYFALDDPDGNPTGPWWAIDSVDVIVE